MDVQPGRDLDGSQAGIPPTQPGGASSGVPGSFEPGSNLLLVVGAVAGVLGGLVDNLLGQGSLLRLLVIAVVVGLAVGLLGRLAVWILRERAVRRAADRALAQPKDGGTGQGA